MRAKLIRESLGEGLGVKFGLFVEELEKRGVPCVVKLLANEVLVECGWDYPDRVADQVFGAADKVGISGNELDLCAEACGHGVPEKTARVAGGPRRYGRGR